MAARNWVFTDNNPSEKQPSWPDAVKYATWQLERGTSGTEHLQGYLELKGPRKLSYLKSILPHAHWEVRRGTQQQAKDYANKEDTRIEGPWQYGTYEPHLPGKRNDLLALKQAIDDGMTYKDLAQEFFPVMKGAYHWVKEYKLLITPDRDHVTRVFLLIGPPGTGKTSWVKRNAPSAFWKYPNRGDTDWWDGYDGQSDVVLDEFYGWIQYRTLLRLIDRYPYMVECKGGHAKFVAKRIFITSNRQWREWYPRIDDLSALERRINEFGTIVTDLTQDLITVID